MIAAGTEQKLASPIHSFAEGLRLRCEGLACERGGRVLFRGLDFEVAGGAALIVRGPNGAGKSSLLRQIAGLVDIPQGRLVLEGSRPDAARQDQLHYVGHQDALKPAMSVGENLSFWSGFLGGAAGGGADIAEALAAFGLDELASLPASYLSAGQKRRVALARLLLDARPLWLLDEPGVALDQANLARLLAAMRSHLERGGIVVAATHQDLGLADARVLDLEPGLGLGREKIPV